MKNRPVDVMRVVTVALAILAAIVTRVALLVRWNRFKRPPIITPCYSCIGSFNRIGGTKDDLIVNNVKTGQKYQ